VVEGCEVELKITFDIELNAFPRDEQEGRHCALISDYLAQIDQHLT
jgi:hypothetical protein